MSEIILSSKNLIKEFSNGEEKNKVLDNINIDIFKGDFTVIMGSSGAGKSTLLYSLSGMDKITSGQVLYNDKDIATLNEKEMAKIRTKEFGFVFQQTYLVSNLTLFENIIVAGYLNKEIKADEIKSRAEQLLKYMNITDSKDRLPSSTSGGEQQRAAMARALINNPKIIFADEPTGALNKANSTEVLNLLTNLNNEGQSIVMVTHDIKSSIRGNRILYLEDGKIVGEKKLEKYEEKNAKDRENEVSKWLTSMEW